MEFLRNHLNRCVQAWYLLGQRPQAAQFLTSLDLHVSSMNNTVCNMKIIEVEACKSTRSGKTGDQIFLSVHYKVHSWLKIIDEYKKEFFLRKNLTCPANLFFNVKNPLDIWKLDCNKNLSSSKECAQLMKIKPRELRRVVSSEATKLTPHIQKKTILQQTEKTAYESYYTTEHKKSDAEEATR